MTREEFIALGKGTTNLVPQTVLPTLAPLTAQSLTGTVNAPPEQVGERSSFYSRNARPGVPFDTEGGLPGLKGVFANLNRDDKAIAQYVQQLPNVRGTRTADTGEIIAEINDPATGIRDVLVNPEGFGKEDVASLLPTIVEMGVGAFFAARGGKPPPGISAALKRMTQSAVAGQATGGAMDTALRGLQGSDIRIKEQARERVKGGVLEVLMGAGLSSAAKAGSRMVSPFSDRGINAVNAEAANEMLKRRYGVEIPLTPAEATENPVLMRLEGAASRRPGASAVFDQMQKEKEQAIRQIQGKILGLAPGEDLSKLPTKEAVGQRATAEAEGQMLAVETAEKQVQQDVATKATKELTEEMGKRSGVTGSVDQFTLGESIRDKALQERDAFKAKAEKFYDPFNSDPRTEKKIVDVAGLANEAKAMKARFPSVEELVEVATDEGTEVQVQMRRLNRFVKSDVRGIVEELAGLEDAVTDLQSLRSMRTRVGDAIAEGEALTGVPQGQLKRIYGMLSRSIDDGLKQIGDPKLSKALAEGDKQYAEGASRFQQRGIADLFREDVNELTPQGIVRRATSGPDAESFYTYNKRFFGENSPEVQQLRRAVVDNLLGVSMDERRATIQAGSFLENLHTLYKQNPSLAKEALGSDPGRLVDIAQTLGVAQGKYDLDETLKLMRAKKASGEAVDITDLQRLKQVTTEKNRVYSNNLMRSVGSGTLPSNFRPSEFVDRMLDGEPAQVNEVLAVVSRNPEVLDEVRISAAQRLFERATSARGIDNLGASLSGNVEFLDGKKLIKELGRVGSNERQNLQTLLGPDTFEDLETLGTALIPSAVREEVSAVGGSISGGTMAIQMLRARPSAFLELAQSYATAALYALPPVRKIVTNQLMDPEARATAAYLALVSTPFIGALVNDFGKQRGAEIASDIAKSAGEWLSQKFKATGPGEPIRLLSTEQPTMSRDEFIRRNQQP